MGSCSVPRLLGFKNWFDERFGDLCENHDSLYTSKSAVSRYDADCKLAGSMFFRGYPFFAIITFVAVRSFGWLFYKRG